MPTTRPRYMVTVTDEVAEALQEAAQRWPADSHSHSRLLLRLIEEGHRALHVQQQETIAVRKAAITNTSGVLSDAYETDYLAQLREDWPA